MKKGAVVLTFVAVAVLCFSVVLCTVGGLVVGSYLTHVGAFDGWIYPRSPTPNMFSREAIKRMLDDKERFYFSLIAFNAKLFTKSSRYFVGHTGCQGDGFYISEHLWPTDSNKNGIYVSAFWCSPVAKYGETIAEIWMPYGVLTQEATYCEVMASLRKYGIVYWINVNDPANVFGTIPSDPAQKLPRQATRWQLPQLRLR